MIMEIFARQQHVCKAHAAVVLYCQWSDVAVGLATVLARQGSFGVEALALLMCRQHCQIRDWINAVWHAVSCSCCSSGGWNLYCGWNLYTPVAYQCQCGVMFIQVS